MIDTCTPAGGRAYWVMRLAALVPALFCVAKLLPGQRSGLLLGVRLSDDMTYRSLWITPGGNEPHVVSGPDLIVPGRNAFSRVCTVRYHELNDGELSIGDTLVVARADLPRGFCATADAVSEEETGNSHCSSESQMMVTFAGSAAIGIQSSAQYNCGAHPDGEASVYLRRLDGDTISFRTALTPAERRRWDVRALAAGKAQYGDLGIFENWTMEDDRAHLSLDDAIGIERAAGRWQATGTVSCTPHVACGSESFQMSIPGFALPRSLIGHDALRPTFAAIVARFPQATDAFSSPRGDVVAVANGGTLQVFLPTGAQLGSPVLSIPFEGTVVMVEWATGRFVSQWSAQLSSIFAIR